MPAVTVCGRLGGRELWGLSFYARPAPGGRAGSTSFGAGRRLLACKDILE
jgi:hypothetical protein